MGVKRCDGSREPGSVAYPFAIIFIGVIVALYGVIYAIDHSLPTPLNFEDEESNPDSFIAESARNYLQKLVSIGPKVTGHSKNEIDAVNYLLDQITEIIRTADSSQKIELSHQIETGSFYLDYKPHGSINAYANIQNVIVKINSEANQEKAVLVNTHFDTVPNSPGGSDDGINVAVALEILRKLSKAKSKPKNSVIFLFNGAEEAGLIASHAFLAHEWHREVGVLVNLEATGGGGKEILFQTGPDKPWLLKYYDVPHPHGNAAGEEVFQSNVIPSDTDFRIFRDYGGYVGYDFAFTRDGYRYHTKYDGFDNIDYGRYQHTGDNILHLVKNLAEAPEVADPPSNEEDGKMVFYDFLGWFFVYYSDTVAIIINVIVVFLSLVFLSWQIYSIRSWNEDDLELKRKPTIISATIYVLILIFLPVLTWVLAVGFVALLATILDACTRSMTWYSVPAINFGLYVSPICAILLLGGWLTQTLMRKVLKTNSLIALMQIHIVRIIWTIILLIGTALGLRMSYVIMVAILFNLIAMLITFILNYFKPNLTTKIWPYIFILSTIIPTMFTYSYGHEVIALFIPILGRFGYSTNPDLLIALMMALFTIMIASYYVPLLVYVKKPWTILIVLCAIFVAALILAATPVGFPYTFNESNPRLQRYSIYHTWRTIRDDQGIELKTDSGFYFTRSDRNSPHSVEGIVKSLEKAISLEEDCNVALACGLPVSNSRSLNKLGSSIWIPAQDPPKINPMTYKCSQSTVSQNKNSKEFAFSVEGSSRIDLYLSMRKGYDLTYLSLVEKIPESTLLWNDQITYYMSFVYGESPAPFEFKFAVETNSEDWSKPFADVAITTKYIDGSVEKTKEYEEFLAEFPEWTVFMVNGCAQYENLVLSTTDNCKIE